MTLLDMTAASLRMKIASEARRLRAHIDGTASAMQAIEEHQRMLAAIEAAQQPLALPIGQPAP